MADRSVRTENPEPRTQDIESEVSLPAWSRKHVLDLDDFSRQEIEQVIETAGAMKEVLSREIRRVPTLRGITVVTLFYEASTRTRSSFELAARRLGAAGIGTPAPARSTG